MLPNWKNIQSGQKIIKYHQSNENCKTIKIIIAKKKTAKK